MHIRRELVFAVMAGSLAVACATTVAPPVSPAPSPIAAPSPSEAPSPIASSSATAPPFIVEGPCEPWPALGVLPEWAREGFSAPEPTAIHALGRNGEIAAILFGGTLFAPPDNLISNKILWVGRDPATRFGQLVISAQRMDGSTPVGDPVERVVDGGPGPSTIDLPEAGCWRMNLRWADRTDSIDLDYVAPTAWTQRLAGT